MKITVDTNIGTIYKWSQWHQITLLVIVFFAATQAVGRRAVLLQDALTKPSKVIILLNLNLNTYIFNILFMKCYMPKYYSCLEEKHMWACLSRTSLFFHVKSFLLQRTADMLLKMKNTCYFKGNNWQCLLPTITFELSEKI